MMDSIYDTVVIGGGPVGGLTAGIIAKAGHSVLILEEHERVGEPVQCAGLITPRVFDMVDFASSSVINKVRGAHIYSPRGQRLTVDAGKTKAVVIDRTKFDTKITSHAQDNGAELRCQSRVTGISPEKDYWTVEFMEKEKKTAVRARLLVGADGSASKTRGWLGLPEPNIMLDGFDAEVDSIDMDNEFVNLFVGNKIAPNFFAWMIPAGERTRVGLCTRETQEPVYNYFKQLFENGATNEFLRGARVVTKSSGRIPLGVLNQTYSDRAMLVGDAASQVKATSGGGIYMGLVCARHCANTAIGALEKNDFTKKTLAAYQKSWMKDIGDELKKDFLLYKVFSSMTDAQFEELFGLFANPEILELINRDGDIDYPSKVAWAILKKEPRFLKYTGKFLKFGLGGG